MARKRRDSSGGGPFSLGSTIRGAVSEFADFDPLNAPPTAPRSGDRQASSGIGGSSNVEGYDVYSAPQDELTQYWRLYETFGPIKRGVNEFAAQVIEPGWWIEADNDSTAENLAMWLRQACILSGVKDQDFAVLLRKAVVQRFVKGTALIEHVPGGNEQGEVSDPTSIEGLKFLKPESITAFTRDNQAYLLQPEDEMPEDMQAELTDVESDIDGTPAYIQFYSGGSGGGGMQQSQTPVPFLQSQVTKSVRDDDVGDIFGTSGLESVLSRSEAFTQKLEDRDQAITTKAWPVWLFKFGNEEDPWFEDEIDSFMDAEAEDQFGPGTKHGVQGDITVDTIETDVPDLREAIDDDIKYILSALPVPEYYAGYQSGDDGTQVAVARQAQTLRRVREERRQLEYDFLPMLQAKCEQESWDATGLKLHIAPPTGEDPQAIYENQGTTINYRGKDQEPGANGDEDSPSGEGAGNQNPSGGSSGGSGNNSGNNDDSSEARRAEFMREYNDERYTN